MTASSPKERLLRRSEEAALRHRRAQDDDERRRGSPEPGDLFQFPETTELQWAVLERASEGRLRAVAADVHPAIGSADVAVPPESACGALSLRCRFAVWLTADAFDLERRTGSLEPVVLERARQKRVALDQGRLVGSSAEQETDREPEYQDLTKELEWTRAALRERQEPAKEFGNKVVPAQPPVRWVSISSPYALAAMILLVVSLTLGAGMVGLSREIERLERHAEGNRRSEPLVGLPFAWLSPQEKVRGPAETLTVSRTASYVVLFLEISDPEPHSGYRLDVREKNADTPVFSDVVAPAGATEANVALPRSMLGAGEYRLSLYGLQGGEAELVEEYGLRLELE